jgi:Ca2+-binding RTX toxin-like protein
MPLEAREVPAVIATFSAGTGVLSVFGDGLDNAIALSRDAAGKILVNGGAVTVLGGTPTVANTALIQAFGQAGNDTLTLSEANGALPAALLFGGAGNDTLTGGSGNDQAFGEAGNDRMVWNPGDDTDLNEGGAGTDTVEVNGGNGAEQFTATANGTRVRFDRLTPAPFSIDVGTSESLVVNMNGGDDSFSATGNLAALIQITVDGGAGNDTILGSNGGDFLIGGDGNDFIDGNQGNDTALMGAGDDVFQWDPGDGSDTAEGQDGTDKLMFFGANIAERFDFSANGSRVLFTRDVGNVATDLNGVERTELRTLGGADTITVGDLSGTDLTNIELALRGSAGGTDRAADAITVNGTQGADAIFVGGNVGGLQVTGLHTAVTVFDADPTLDSLTVNGQAGDDVINAQSLREDTIEFTMTGGLGIDLFFGSDGDDLIVGGDGNDTALMGRGDDTFVWNPGDDSDIVEGQDGTDTMLFNGANIAEKIDIAANGGRVRFTRDVASITMDLNDTEVIDFNALGGADTITVGDLSGTDVTEVNLNLAGTGGAGDSAADTVTVTGTAGDDVIQAAGDATGVSVTGLAALVNITGAEAANDRLKVNAQAGDDVVVAAGLTADAIQFAVDGGDGDDVLLGGPGQDVLDGGPGDNILLQD